MTESFALSPEIDIVGLQREFSRSGKVRVSPFLTGSSAKGLRRSLNDRDDWCLVLNAGDKLFEIPVTAEKAFTEEQRRTLDRLVADSAAEGFQFRFDTVRVPDDPAERVARGSLLDDFAMFLSSAPVVDLFRSVTGRSDISFADAQATRYRPGHFLNAHDDDVAGKNRRAAYVLSLTEGWRPEWGGLLTFHGLDGEQVFAPAFNTLTLFAVPQLHSVSPVAPAAKRPRLSVTGWLRAAAD